MKLLDCTLRDGANVVGNGFSRELTDSMLKGMLQNGITAIEFGNAKGMGAYEKVASVAPLTDLEYLQLAQPYATRGELGMFMLAKCAAPECAQMAADYGMRFMRVGNNAGDGKMSLDAVKSVKDAGLYCRYSLMKAYISTPEQLAEESAMLEQEGVDCITIMDSAGTMTPKDAAAYTAALKQAVKIPVGFHGHNNLGLSQANALAALEYGADELDCGLLGMARSAGNCSTELLAAVLEQQEVATGVDLLGLLQYLDEELIPAMAQHQYKPAVMPVDLILGMSGCHSTFLNLFKTVADRYGVSLYQLITAVSKLDRKAPSKELIERIAETLRCGRVIL